MRVRFFDTESTDLQGNFGRLLSYSRVDLPVPACKGGDKCACRAECVTFRRDAAPWRGRKQTDDQKLVLAIRSDLEDADMIVGWNSILHDVPLINARLAAYGERPLRLGERYGTAHLDLMWYASGASMKIGGRSLANVSKFFKSPHMKTPLLPEVWADASGGDREAMDLIIEHNEFDALVTRDVWQHLAPYVKKFQFSLAEVYPFLHLLDSRTMKERK